MQRAVLLFVLLTVDGVLGIATLLLDLPLVLSIAHQFGAVLVLAAALSGSPGATVRAIPDVPI